MFDSHCHLHATRIVAEAGKLIARARAAGVERFLLAGVEPDGWRVEAELARAHAGVFVSYGVHPQVVDQLDDRETDGMLTALVELLARPEVAPVAVGEIGLDGLGARKATLERQARAFRAQLELAEQYRLPVALHVLDAHARAIALLDAVGVPKRGGVVHSYSGSAELAREYLALGLHLSFAGPVANERARKTRAAALATPQERLLVETDAPDQTPLKFRPRSNEPAFLVAIVAALAQIRGEPERAVAQYTDGNARRLFGVE